MELYHMENENSREVVLGNMENEKIGLNQIIPWKLIQRKIKQSNTIKDIK